MGFIADACKQRIRDRVAIEEVVREHGVQLIPSGRRLKGLCPFHSEKTPSFSIDVEKQYYHCFGCEASGDAFSFVMQTQHLGYPEALELLARRAGVELEYVDGAGPARKGETVVKLYDALEIAKGFYHRQLLDDPSARRAQEYLKNRGILPETWERFHLGFSSDRWDGFLRFATKEGIPVEVLEKAGLIRKRTSGGGYYDYFRGRLMFPIDDPQSRVIGFGARTLGDDVPKYLNTAKTPVFDKSQVLYALPHARMGIRREERVAVVEGYTDAVMAHQAGLDFFVASLGTAFTSENARRLSRLAPRALLIFDGDDAGQKASERSLDLLVSESLDVRVYTVTDGKDPCDAILSLGGPEFRRRLVEESVSLFEFKWRRTMESAGTEEAGPALRAKALDAFLSLFGRISNPVARKLELRQFSERLGVPEADMEERLKHLLRLKPSALPRSDNVPVASGEEARASAKGIPDLERVVLECILALPHKAKAIWSQVPRELFTDSSLLSLVASIERQLEDGEFSTTRLAHEVEDPATVARLMSRVEDAEGNPTLDYEDLLLRVERDLGRYNQKTRARNAKARMTQEALKGESETLAVLRRDYFESLREMKRG
jgi:DNA primase